MKMYLKNTSLIFGSSRFHGGRLDKKGDGIVEVCFEWDKELNEMLICLFDDTSKEDGHYSPVSMPLEDATTLRDWLSVNIGESVKHLNDVYIIKQQ